MILLHKQRAVRAVCAGEGVERTVLQVDDSEDKKCGQSGGEKKQSWGDWRKNQRCAEKTLRASVVVFVVVCAVSWRGGGEKREKERGKKR